MINSVRALPERGTQPSGCGSGGGEAGAEACRRLSLIPHVGSLKAALLLPRLLALGLLSLWPLVQANGQTFTFNTVNPMAIAVGSNLTFTLSVTPLPPDGVFFGHGGLAPANSFPTNASLDSVFGTFSWTPNQSQLGANSITVWAVETSQSFNSNYTTFTVTVTNAVPPGGGVVIDTIAPQTVAEGTTLTFTNHAYATDNTNNALQFSLIGAPAGATMTNDTPTSGVFTWTPTSAQAQTPSYTIRELVAEVGTTASNFQDFQVAVTRTNDCAQFDQFLAAVQQGGYFLISNCTTIVLTNALTISNSVTLDAGTNGVTIAGQGGSRLFTVLSDVTNFTLRGLTLSGGRDPSGGGLYINPGAVVTLTDCTFVGNGAVGANGADGKDGGSGQNGGSGTAGNPGVGGAIYNLGGLTAVSCQFLTNSATGGSGGAGGAGGDESGTLSQGGNGGNGSAGAAAYGGAVYNLGTLSLSNCTFSGNSASSGNGGTGGLGGAGRFPGSPGNGAAGASSWGGALFSAQSLRVVDCTFSANLAQGGNSAAGGTDSNGDGVSGARGADSLGGGICILDTAFLTNCTFADNLVTGGNGGDGGNGTRTLAQGGNGGNGGNGTGGGLYNTGAVVVVNCTFSGCGAVGGTNGVAGSAPFPGSNGSPGRGRGGDIAQGSGSFVLQNSILGASSAGTNAYDTSASRITDGGYNLSSDASLNLSGTSLKNTDPMLGSLASNGGPTPTIALQTNSPALDRIPPNLAPATDQRGVSRPQGPASDVGAYELVMLPAIVTQPQSQTNVVGTPVTFTVSALGDSLGYQWRFNTAGIASATGTSYTIASVDPTNAGSYDVVITNTFGAVTSTPAILTVISPPATGTVFTVSGRIVQGDSGLGGVAVAAGTNVSITGADGYYTNVNVPQGAALLVPALGTYAFAPSAQSVVVLSNTTLPDFMAFPSLALAGTSGGPAHLAFSAGFTCRLEASADLINWQTLSTSNNVSTEMLLLTFSDTDSTNLPMRFYRVGQTLAGRPVFTNCVATNYSVSLECISAPVIACWLEASTNLSDWVILSSTNLNQAAPFQFRYSEPTPLPRRFYRLSQTPGF